MLNSHQTLEYQINSDEWKDLVINSKFKEYPLYGQAKSGHIGLQDHDYTVRFKNIRIKVLDQRMNKKR